MVVPRRDRKAVQRLRRRQPDATIPAPTASVGSQDVAIATKPPTLSDGLPGHGAANHFRLLELAVSERWTDDEKGRKICDAAYDISLSTATDYKTRTAAMRVYLAGRAGDLQAEGLERDAGRPNVVNIFQRVDELRQLLIQQPASPDTTSTDVVT